MRPRGLQAVCLISGADMGWFVTRASIAEMETIYPGRQFIVTTVPAAGRYWTGSDFASPASASPVLDRDIVVADEVDEVHWQNLPDPAYVRIGNDLPIEVTGGSFTFKTSARYTSCQLRLSGPHEAFADVECVADAADFQRAMRRRINRQLDDHEAMPFDAHILTEAQGILNGSLTVAQAPLLVASAQPLETPTQTANRLIAEITARVSSGAATIAAVSNALAQLEDAVTLQDAYEAWSLM